MHDEPVVERILKWAELGAAEEIMIPCFGPFLVVSLEIVNSLGDCLARAG